MTFVSRTSNEKNVLFGANLAKCAPLGRQLAPASEDVRADIADCRGSKTAQSNLLVRLMKGALRAVAAASVWVGGTVAQPLPSLNLDVEQTTVSGLSSGAFMAVQLQVAFSSKIAGAGIVAGGPFNCADSSLWRALYVCMDPFWVEADAERSLLSMQTLADEGRIDALDGILDDKLYLFHGQADDTVDRATMDALEQTYLGSGVPPQAIIYSVLVDAGHGFVTEQGRIACAETEPDFLIDCDVDQAGDILNWLYDDLSAPAAPRPDGLQTFEQSLYTQNAAGMDSMAFIYVPASCAAGDACRLHIALHGCKQGREAIGEDYARLTGYNRWAEANNIVVLYPQAVKIPSPWYNWFAGNPNGCWDWWGYSGSDYLSRTAPQPAAIARMAEALGAPLSP